MMSAAKRVYYTLEFKLEAVRLVKAGQSLAAVGATPGIPAQTIANWVKTDQEGKLGGAYGTKPVSPEQMELLTRGVRLGKERVRGLVARHGIRARHERKYIATTNSNHSLPVAPNLLG